jgi:hypothetical protein
VKKLLNLIALFIVVYIAASAQAQPFGKIDTADLKLTTCDFEKGARAMVLFDVTDIKMGPASTTILEKKHIAQRRIHINKGFL